MQIIGHRGARGEAPENTLGGFHYLRNLGVGAVEFDVRQLCDRQLVVIHDDQLQRTTGQHQQLYACTYPELQPYNQAQLWPNWAPFEPTPLLSDTLSVIENFQHIEVEIKAVDTWHDAEQLVTVLHQQLKGFEQNAVITSFDHKILQVLMQCDSPFQRGLLVEDDLKFKAIDQALALNCCQIGWKDSLATDAIINATQQANLAISVWTVNNLQRAQQLHDLGIQGLITDYPQRMLSYFSTRLTPHQS
ncbi:MULTISPECIES: glycerophosphodiester phosphodiesterase [unclassified Acinetobacter]|uniref:glycerophosphodiester phosphodiesterase n=1 Tax=unclassified Acinetobacter TaxID=196816 RepID=UPI002934B27C|nr:MULTISPECIES: glycerophosphodiester phosphodiesterase [unclassified Acinetobacter]WOE30479.1 glycerophosphodiester phosphodiesterase [Acinetobacter sp. SAAs470]WOE38670.1 glycerophosphodiester phosphodiesterase [Acinetobacter sp. SAAs474]